MHSSITKFVSDSFAELSYFENSVMLSGQMITKFIAISMSPLYFLSARLFFLLLSLILTFLFIALARTSNTIFFFFFLGTHPRHMEVPRLGVKLEL